MKGGIFLKIKLDDIMVAGLYSAELAATNAAKSDEPLSVDKIQSIKRSYVLRSKYAVDVVSSMIAGSIQSYHYQLREKLLESGIDIGELDMESRELRKSVSGDRE